MSEGYVYFWKNKNVIMLMSCVPTFSMKMGDNMEMSCMSQEKHSYHSFHEFSTAKYESELLFTF